MNKGLPHTGCTGVVFVGAGFALTTGGGLLSAETSEDFLAFPASLSPNPQRYQGRGKGRM